MELLLPHQAADVAVPCNINEYATDAPREAAPARRWKQRFVALSLVTSVLFVYVLADVHQQHFATSSIPTGPDPRRSHDRSLFTRDNTHRRERGRRNRAAFTLVPLGTGGGPYEDDISSYLIASASQPGAPVCFDTGTLLAGIARAVTSRSFGEGWKPLLPPGAQLIPNLSKDGEVLSSIERYFVSHAHLDHNSGFVIASPMIAPSTFGSGLPHRTVLGLATTVTGVKSSFFNGVAWPPLDQYGSFNFETLVAGTPFSLPREDWQVTPFPLVHDSEISTAFVARDLNGFSFVYFGDTQPDFMAPPSPSPACSPDPSSPACPSIRHVWDNLAEDVRSHRLRAVLLEASYPSSRLDSQLYGHMTPCYLVKELRVLKDLAGVGSLQGVTVFVTHIKPTLAGNAREEITAELLSPTLTNGQGTCTEQNDLGVEFIVPTQGLRYYF